MNAISFLLLELNILADCEHAAPDEKVVMISLSINAELLWAPDSARWFRRALHSSEKRLNGGYKKRNNKNKGKQKK